MAPDLAKVFDGAPCKRCGGTRRWKSNRHCIACEGAKTRKRLNERYRTDPSYRDRKLRGSAAHNQRMYYDPGIEGVKYRGRRQLADRRHKAMRRKAAREQGQRS